MTILATILCLALTRAEILERFRAPVITQSDGLIKVYADCPEDMRREFQSPIARFAADTVDSLRRSLARKALKMPKAGIVIHVGDVRTNLAEVVSRASTNGDEIVTRIYVRSPGYADLYRFRCEIAKAFFRCVGRIELTDEAALKACRKADPELRVQDELRRLDDWLLEGKGDPEEGLRQMRKVITPGRASPREVLVFASRLHLYPPQNDLRFLGRFDGLSFREALKVAKIDPFVRIVAFFKANEIPVFGGGRGEALSAAADAYMNFLRELAKGEAGEAELEKMLDDADVKLNVAYEEACKR